jgi:hypothetical protein
MDKALDNLQLTHRLLMALTLALALLALSAEPPSNDYKDIQAELRNLQEAMSEASEFREKRNKEIFDKSPLKGAIIEWLKSKHRPEGRLEYTIIEPDSVRVPDSEINPLVTVSDQVLWADKLFDGSETPFYLCLIKKADLFSTLERLAQSKKIRQISVVTIDMKKTVENFVTIKREVCAMSFTSIVEEGDISGQETTQLELPARLASISRICVVPARPSHHGAVSAWNLHDFIARLRSREHPVSRPATLA